jgi:hypothetical protein
VCAAGRAHSVMNQIAAGHAAAAQDESQALHLQIAVRLRDAQLEGSFSFFLECVKNSSAYPQGADTAQAQQAQQRNISNLHSWAISFGLLDRVEQDECVVCTSANLGKQNKHTLTLLRHILLVYISNK